MIAYIIKYWNSLPNPVQVWLKGMEVAVITGVVSAVLALPVSNLTTKAGVLKFIGIVVAAAGGCVRLYLAQSPVQNVVKEVEASRTVSSNGVAVKDSVTEKITQ